MKQETIAGMKGYFFDTIGSTNAKAKELFRETQEDFFIFARTQSCGRGRFNREWISPKGGVWLSFGLIDVKGPIGLLSFCASLSVYDTIEEYLSNSQIKSLALKWPNDVYYMKKKLSGILMENQISRRRINVVTGIGININNKIPDDLSDTATSVRKIVDREINNEQFTGGLIKNFKRYLSLFSSEQYDIIRKQWTKNCYLIGKHVSLKTINGEISGIFSSINEDGFAVIDDGNKKILVKEGDLTY